MTFPTNNLRNIIQKLGLANEIATADRTSFTPIGVAIYSTKSYRIDFLQLQGRKNTVCERRSNN